MVRWRRWEEDLCKRWLSFGMSWKQQNATLRKLMLNLSNVAKQISVL
jgi:hypothetical protein